MTQLNKLTVCGRKSCRNVRFLLESCGYTTIIASTSTIHYPITKNTAMFLLLRCIYYDNISLLC